MVAAGSSEGENHGNNESSFIPKKYQSYMRYDKYVVGDIIRIDAESRYCRRNVGYIRKALEDVPYEIIEIRTESVSFDKKSIPHQQLLIIKNTRTNKIYPSLYSGCYFIPLRPTNATREMLE